MLKLLTSTPPPFAVKRWSLDDYHRMIDLGILTEEDKVELLEGWIVPKMPRNPPHEDAIQNTDYLLRDILPKGWRVRVQSPVTIALAESEPEPDIYVHLVSRRKRPRHPEPRDTALVIEVSDSTLAQDRAVKQKIYARGRVPVYWIINIGDRQIEVFSDPTGPSPKPKYRDSQIYRNGESVPVIIAGKEVGKLRASDMLPAA